jgi:PIN domain nuclease of toxin-antitoxin system
MNILLDTHVALWAVTDDDHLSRDARQYLEDSENRVFVSAASVWEISIKHAIRSGEMPLSGADAKSYFEASGYTWVPITASHAAAVDGLPPIHKDPFDRILVAQAMHEPLLLLTHDKRLVEYSASAVRVV